MFDFVTEFDQPHCIFFRCEDDFLIIMDAIQSLPDIPQVINAENMMITVKQGIIGFCGLVYILR